MHALSASDIVRTWEVGQRQQYTDKALFLLALAWPSLSLSTLNSLTIGQRNAHLLSLRKKTLGPLANCFSRCPFCNEQLEFTLDIQAMLSSEVTEPVEAGETSEQIHTLDIDGYHLRFRVSIGADLVESVQIAYIQSGRTLLLERSVFLALMDSLVSSDQ